MAQLIEGDVRGFHRRLIGNTPGLPPRFPTLPNRGVPLSDWNTALQGIYGSSGSLDRNYQQPKGMPSYSVLVQDRPLVSANLVEESEFSTSKALHCHSASESLTYKEKSATIPMFGNIAEEVEVECHIDQAPQKVAKDANEDGDQLTDLLEEIQHLQDQQNLPISARSTVHLNVDSPVVNKTGSTKVDAIPGHTGLEPKNMLAKDLDYYVEDSNNMDGMCLFEQPENDLDPKRAKRVLANRQSAQRSRVRKLQYIADLERIVGTLQMEISTLSLQVIYLRHQRAILNMDNNALKQQAVFFVQEKRNKDTQNELLKHDIRRLQKLNEFQSLHKSSPMQKQQQPQPRPIQRHSSLPTDFVHQPGELDVGSHPTKTEFSSADGLTGLMRDLGGMSLDVALRRDKFHIDKDSIETATVTTMEPNEPVGELSGGEFRVDDT